MTWKHLKVKIVRTKLIEIGKSRKKRSVETGFDCCVGELIAFNLFLSLKGILTSRLFIPTEQRLFEVRET